MRLINCRMGNDPTKELITLATQSNDAKAITKCIQQAKIVPQTLQSIVDDKNLPLIAICLSSSGKERFQCIKSLQKAGIDLFMEYKLDNDEIDESYLQSITSLMHACILQDTKAMEFLISLRKDTDERSADEYAMTLNIAANNNFLEGAKVLCQPGRADANRRTVTGKLPLITAAINGHQDFIDLLFSYDMNIEAKNEDGQTLLIEAIINHSPSHTVECLAKATKNINDTDNDSKSAVLHAVSRGEFSIACMLLQKPYNADPFIKGQDGKSLLHYAAMSGAANLVYVYLDVAGKEKNNLDNNRMSALHLSKFYGHESVSKILIDFDCYARAVDSLGFRPTELVNARAVVIKAHPEMKNSSPVQIEKQFLKDKEAEKDTWLEDIEGKKEKGSDDEGNLLDVNDQRGAFKQMRGMLDPGI